MPSESAEPHDPALPVAVAPLPAPDDNPMSAAGFALGRALFYDPALSADGSVSCGTCHQQRYAFGDNQPTSIGAGGASTALNTPPLINLAWSERLFWDGRADSIESALQEHIADPTIFARSLDTLPAALSAHSAGFQAAFSAEPTAEGAVKALAQFVRGLVSFSAPVDRIYTSQVSLTAQQERGGALLAERLGLADGEHRCNTCHSRTAGLTEDGSDRSGLFTSGAAARNGTGSWRVPTIRNIAVTAPYFHDGSQAALTDVLAHYSSLPQDVDAALKDEAGAPVRPAFSESDREDLAALLTLFTDPTFLQNPDFSAP